MPSIHITTFVGAPIERVYDLCRHIAVYKSLFQNRNQQFTTSGSSKLMNAGESFTVVGKLAMKTRLITIRITAANEPLLLTHEQVKGDLQQYKHVQHLKPIDNGTIVIDLIEYEFPKDLPGRIMSQLYLKKSIEQIVAKKNEIIRSYGETEKWRAILT